MVILLLIIITIISNFLLLMSFKSMALDVVAGEGAEQASALTGADVPTVVALLQNADCVAVLKFQFVIILRGVRVQRPI